jgi:hypothetical protein
MSGNRLPESLGIASPGVPAIPKALQGNALDLR